MIDPNFPTIFGMNPMEAGLAVVFFLIIVSTIHEYINSSGRR